MISWILQLTHQIARVAAVTEAILPITSLGRGLKRNYSPALIFPRFEQSCLVVKSNGVGGDDLVWLVVDLDLVGLVVELVRLVVDIVGLAVVHLVGLVGLVVDLGGRFFNLFEMVADLGGLVRWWVDHVRLVVLVLGFLVGLVVDLADLVVDLVGLVVPLVDLVVGLIGLGVDCPLFASAAAEGLASECC